MTERHNAPAGFAGLIQLWTSQLRQITEGLTGTAGLSDPVLPQAVPSLQGLPHPGQPELLAVHRGRQRPQRVATGYAGIRTCRWV